MRSHVEDFAAALDSPFASGDADADEELRRLVAVAHEFQVLPVRPRVDFRADLRARLVAAADEPRPSRSARLREACASWRTRRTVTAFAACAVVLILLASIAVAATRSLPGDPLYAAKRAAESLHVDLARSDAARSDVHIDLARRRLHELRVLASRGIDGHSLPLLDEMDAETLSAVRNTTSTEGRDRLRVFAGRQYDELAALLPRLDSVVAARAIRSLAMLDAIRRETAAFGAAPDPGQLRDSDVAPRPPAPGSSAVPGPVAVPGSTGSVPKPGRGAAPGQPGVAPPTEPSPQPFQGAAPGRSGAPLPTVAPFAPAPPSAPPSVPTRLPANEPLPAPTANPLPQPTAEPAPQPVVPAPTPTGAPLPTVAPLPTESGAPLPTVTVPPLPTDSLPPLPALPPSSLPTVPLPSPVSSPGLIPPLP